MTILVAVKMIRLIVADDHPVIIDGIKAILNDQQDIRLVATAHEGKCLLEKVKEHQPDLVLMDINMPGMDGIEATRELLRLYPEIKVLAFSQYDEKRFVKRVIKNGASGYLLKSLDAEEFINAVKTVVNGEIYLSEGLPNIFEEKPKRRSIYDFPKLTARELEVLRCICEEKCTQEIAEELVISTNTVETHRSNLLLKVGARNTAGLVRWAAEYEVV